MSEKKLEAILASPPEREELVVQLFLRNGGQWGEVFCETGEFWIDIYRSENESPLRINVKEMIDVLSLSVNELRQRLETT